MGSRKIFAALCALGFASVVFARGKKNVETIEASNKDGWQESFDINNKKAGKYNIYVKATDMGGNETMAGPFNLYIDPKSDLPVCGITNPTPQMRVRGNLNIVGTCVDDDAVGYVELVLDGDEENVVRAQGKDFWSYYLDTRELSEGPHTIKVFGTDVNGLRGNPTTLTWNLDRKQPATQVQNHEMGVLVGGSVQFKGIITDGNGIASLAYSLDNGENFIPTKISEDKKTKNCSFSVQVNTKQFDDGPRVLWFKAKDKAGTEGVYSFLYFIDNTPPDVAIVTPEAKETKSGIFSVAGYAKDTMGVTSLAWTFGSEKGEFPIVPGNPYWSQEFNTIGSKDKSRKFTVTAKDLAGNVVSVSRDVPLNQELDRPVLVLSDPVPDAAIDDGDGVFIRGFATDNGRVAKVKYSLDGGSEGEYETECAFSVMVVRGSELSSGKHSIKVVAVDSNGVESLPAVAQFTARGAAPFFQKPSIISGKSAESAVNGMVVHTEGGSSFSIEITSSVGMTRASWQTISGDEVISEKVVEPPKNPVMSVPVSIPIDGSFPRGVVKICASATDIYDRVSEYRLILKVADPSLPAEVYPDEPEQYVNGDGEYEGSAVKFVSVNDEPYEWAMPVTLSQTAKAGEVTLKARVESDDPLSSAKYEISGDAVPGGDATQTGSARLIKPAAGESAWGVEIPLARLPARATNVKVTVTTSKKETKEGSACLRIVRPASDARSNDEKGIHVMPSSGVIVAEGGRRLNMTTGQSVVFYANVIDFAEARLSRAAQGLDLSVEGKTATLTPSASGIYDDVRVIVTDGSGKTYESPAMQLAVSSSAPEVHIATPAQSEWVKNSIRVTGTAADTAGIVSVEYSLDGGESWEPLDVSGGASGAATFSKDISIEEIEEGLVRLDVRATSAGGVVGYDHAAFARFVTPPEVSPVLPLDTDIVNGENTIAFAIKTPIGIRSVEYVAPSGARREEVPVAPLVVTNIGTEAQPINDAMAFEFTDMAGNKTVIDKWQFIIDSDSDLPRVEIHLPVDNEVIIDDFTISGVVYDDDGDANVFYKIDDGAYTPLPDLLTNFSIDVPLASLVDNEHTITMYAVDVNGTRGEETQRVFRVSLEEPKGAVTTPSFEETVRDAIKIEGVASDKNGIALVEVSLDNGSSYNKAIGTERWEYTVDTRAIPDGTQAVFIKVTDNYGITGLYSSLVNIDNISPELSLELPLDGSKTTGTLFFSGYAFDNIVISDMRLTVRSLEGKSVPSDLIGIPVEPDMIVTRILDVSSLQNGLYNVELTAEDRAGNISRVSRNIEVDKNKPVATVDLLYPFDGERKQGVFNIYGQVAAEKGITGLALYIDDSRAAETEETPTGFFKFNVTTDLMSDGEHTYRVDASIEGGGVISSRTQTVTYSSVGPWLTIDNFTYGDFAMRRPYIRGTAGYSISDDELLLSKTKDATAIQKQSVAEKKVARIEISFDNGRTFKTVSKGEKWRYRVENTDLAEGYHFMLARATMANGESAIERVVIQIDNTAPFVRLISPAQGGRYNQSLDFSGLSGDKNGLDAVDLVLRKGDKSSYQVPKFLQGLYLDWHFWGATLFDVGFGLTFFDDNVKVQFQFGQFTQAQRDIFSKTDLRYGGDVVLGIKILANVASIPFGYFFGHDLDWLSMTFAIGADFSWFNETNSGKSQILSALLVQMEFPRVTLANAKRFRTFCLYTEFSLWFIPTDVSSDADIKNLIPQIAEGIRLNIF